MFFEAYDLIWLLLPVAAASGWYMAKRDDQARDADFELPSAYFKGLNFLLNEQTDKAIEVFIQVLEVNSETVETHLALGNLFRRRGEVDRAIRIHQNLIARPTLDRSQRAHALVELGQDYFKAGLLDRAEKLFLELVEVRAHSELALRYLVNIYQQEREWDRAISVSRRLERVSGKTLDAVIAQYHCELAEAHMARGANEAARDQLKKAFVADRGAVRASMLLGDIEAGLARHREALRVWRRIEDQDPRYLGEVADRIAHSYRAGEDEQGLYRYFEGVLARRGDPGVVLAFADAIERRDGLKAAEVFLLEWQKKKPSLRGVTRLLALSRAQASDAQARDEWTVLHGLMQRLLDAHMHYVCQECGFGSRTLYWQCPGCQRWNTMLPNGGGLDA